MTDPEQAGARRSGTSDWAASGTDAAGGTREVWGRNNFGLIRLLLAACVVFGHTPELIDGSRVREPLTNIFGVLSLGEVSVDGFFLISGYLLTSSLVRKPALLPYFVNRIGRIYPGFVVAFVFCVLVVAPLADAPSPPLHMLLRNIVQLALLQPPSAEGVFDGAPFPVLNGSMWTICYEFGCYVLLALLSVTGVLRRPALVLTACCCLLLVLAVRLRVDLATFSLETGGSPQNVVRFASAFLWGSTLKLWLTHPRRRGWAAVASAVVVLLALGNRWCAEPVLIVAGGYALICAAEWPFSRWASAVGTRTDVSYGLYLYAWPVQNLLIWKLRLTDPLAVSGLTLLCALPLAFLSWTLVERKAVRLSSAIARAVSRPSLLPALAVNAKRVDNGGRRAGLAVDDAVQ